MPIGGPAIHAYLSEEAKEGWTQVSEDNGVSITGLMEIMGLEFAEMIKDNGGEADGLPKDLLFLDLVKRARKVDAQRRRRS